LIWIASRARGPRYKMPMATCLRHLLGPALLVLAMCAAAQAPAPWPARGELLYNTHCSGCHNEQMHWRNKKLAVDWETLVAQVARWQALDKLGWSEAEVVDVARYLNETIYRYAQTTHRVSLLGRQR
jgi:mono/diheme cytochrome c family protein